MKLGFYGAARRVTGACFMLRCEGGNVLVDCGMRQGADADGEYGESGFPFQAEDVSAVLLTHAHIDHSGLIPLLVKRGYGGPILCTEATAQLSTIMLPDSAHIQEQEAAWQNRKNERAGKPTVEPLYTGQDVQRALKLYRGVEYDKKIQLLPSVVARFTNVGHLLGSAAIELFVTENGKTAKVVFSGDVGRDDRPILEDPDEVTQADYLILESTYGDRNHDLTTSADKERELADVLRAALTRGGNIIIPSFAVGRTQEMLYYIKKLIKENTVPGLERVPVYIDSPLAIEATKVYERCAEGYYDAETRALAADGSPFDFPTLHVAVTADESKLINDHKGQAIIISSSGMCDAGRVRHHLKHNLYRADATVLFAGYQAVGTLGRLLVDGVKKVRLFGEDVRVNAHIVQSDGFSGHAGKDELIAWAGGISPKPRRVFLVHGEESALESLEAALDARGYCVTVPPLGGEYALTPQQDAADAPKADGKARDGREPAPRGGKAEKARDKAAQAPAPAETDTVHPLETTEPGYDAERELARIEAVLARSGERRSPDMALLRTVLEADLRSLADKWEALIG